MTDILELIGIKTSSLVAGVFGAVASLTYERNIGVIRAMILIVTGATCAAYLTPLAASWLELSDNTESAYAFIIGLLSMKIIGGLMTIGDRFRRDPESFIKFFRKDKDGSSAADH